MNANRKILAQGDKDGACFLYSVANAFQALLNQTNNSEYIQITQTQWNQWISRLPFKTDIFLSTKIGTKNLEFKSGYLESFCIELAKTLDVKIQLQAYYNISSSKALNPLITENSVMLCCINNGTHWVVIVDVDSEKVFMTCSAEALKGKKLYEESETRFGRFSNANRLFKGLKLFESYGLLISLN